MNRQLNEIHLRRVGAGKFVPAFTAQLRRGVAYGAQLFQRQWVHTPGRLAARAVRHKAPRTQGVDDGFGHDAARGIAGAENEDLIRLNSHEDLHKWKD